MDNVWILPETGYRLDKRKADSLKSYGDSYYQIGEAQKSAKFAIRHTEKKTEKEMVLKSEGHE